MDIRQLYISLESWPWRKEGDNKAKDCYKVEEKTSSLPCTAPKPRGASALGLTGTPFGSN